MTKYRRAHKHSHPAKRPAHADTAELVLAPDAKAEHGPSLVDSAYLAISLDVANIIVKAAREYADEKWPPQITIVKRPMGGLNIVIIDGTKEALDIIYSQISEYFGEAGKTEHFYDKQVIAFPHRPSGAMPLGADKRHAGFKSLLATFGKSVQQNTGR